MINMYEPKPIEAMQFTGANENDIKSWLEGFGYTVSVSVNAQGFLELFIQQLDINLTVLDQSYVVYWVGEIRVEALTSTEISARFVAIP